MECLQHLGASCPMECRAHDILSDIKGSHDLCPLDILVYSGWVEYVSLFHTAVASNARCSGFGAMIPKFRLSDALLTLSGNRWEALITCAPHRFEVAFCKQNNKEIALITVHCHNPKRPWETFEIRETLENCGLMAKLLLIRALTRDNLIEIIESPKTSSVECNNLVCFLDVCESREGSHFQVRLPTGVDLKGSIDVLTLAELLWRQSEQ